MLVWALWLARALLAWLRFAWTTLIEGGFWSPPKPKKGAIPPMPAAADAAGPGPSDPSIDDAPRESVPELNLDLPRTASQRPPEPDDEK
jgi:hypothetical protein